jgi:magnesium chelatase family protein
MVARLSSVSFMGINTLDIDVQVHLSSGLPNFNIVGLADKSVGESKDRIRSAFSSLGLALPAKRITVNLAPADVHKEGSHYDLVIALGILTEMDIIPFEEITQYIILGELALDGSISAVNGILPASIAANAAEKGVVCPAANAVEASWSGNGEIIAPENLLEIINHFSGRQLISRVPPEIQTRTEGTHPDLADVKGQAIAKRALEIAAAGGHNMLMIGPPGSGKSMLAARLPGIIPPLETKEVLEASMIASIVGEIDDRRGLVTQRPFRTPHCSSSMAAIVGGGRNAKPGEVTLAHHGVLFLDELPEFSRNVLDALRQPIETGEITIARVNSHVTYPANFQLVAAMNPCKCGYYGDIANSCSKAPLCAEQYQSRISGPLLDRFDIKVDVVNSNIFTYQNEPAEPSEQVRTRVIAARDIQAKRYANKGIRLNSQADGQLLMNVVNLDQESQDFLRNSLEKINISMRAHNRILRVARTIADLQKSENVSKSHLAEALSFRVAKLTM